MIFRATKYCQALPNFKSAIVLALGRPIFCQATLIYVIVHVDLSIKFKESVNLEFVSLHNRECLPPFSLICDFGKQNTCGSVSKISVSLECYWQIRLKSTNCRATSGPSNPLYVMLLGCDIWWISIRSVNNTQDWWKFWKRLRMCFVFQSRVSTKMVVIPVFFDVVSK